MRGPARALVPALMLFGSVSVRHQHGAEARRRVGVADERGCAHGKARAIHERVMALDTHVDIEPGNFRVGELNYSQRLNTQVDLTKMEEGGLDAIFFSIYVGQGALDSAGYARAYATDTAKFNAVHRSRSRSRPLASRSPTRPTTRVASTRAGRRSR